MLNFFVDYFFTQLLLMIHLYYRYDASLLINRSLFIVIPKSEFPRLLINCTSNSQHINDRYIHVC